jgi:hypothetical protein
VGILNTQVLTGLGVWSRFGGKRVGRSLRMKKLLVLACGFTLLITWNAYPVSTLVIIGI